jgi:hypothetical protein
VCPEPRIAWKTTYHTVSAMSVASPAPTRKARELRFASLLEARKIALMIVDRRP